MRTLICKALADAGIKEPETQEGIDFCTTKCPYPACIASARSLKQIEEGFEEKPKRIVKAEKRSDKIIRLYKEGLTKNEIAEAVGAEKSTVLRHIRYYKKKEALMKK